MKHYTEYQATPKKIKKYYNRMTGEKKTYDCNIYTFDIETTSYIYLNDTVYEAIRYDELSEEQQEQATFQATMYIWQFGINDIVYYGRTWSELISFLDMLECDISEHKIVFVHNLSYEFQFIWKVLKVKEVFSRKKRKVIKCNLQDYNIEFRCSYQMSATALENLPHMFNLSVEKKTGDLDYTLLRTSSTELTEKELEYCEYDCLVVYEYIKYELNEYKYPYRIPLTSTGHVRRELKELIYKDKGYKEKTQKAINTDPTVYNMLVKAFAGGYTHANYIYAGDIIEDVDSWDFTSSYPYVLVTHKYPATEFKKVNSVQKFELDNNKCYLLTVRLKGVKSKYFNTIISLSKCEKASIHKGVYDNGRIVSADELTITLTDVDFKLIKDWYIIDEIEYLEVYEAYKNYLPKLFINFVLDKYVLKTKYKGVKGEEITYNREKGRFNALYGMSVTNDIRAEVQYSAELGWLEDRDLTDDEIQDKLNGQKEQGFMSFATGVWVTAYARNNLLRNLMKLDEHAIYCDTDSIKLRKGYDRTIIDTYNDFVLKKLKQTSQALDIDVDRFAPKDIKGNRRPLGVFDDDGHYKEFKTLGAKKYIYRDSKDDTIHITVSGVPKKASITFNSLEEFNEGHIFEYKDTGKKMLSYNDVQVPCSITDYQGKTYIVDDLTGVCMLPCTYKLSNSDIYRDTIDDDYTKRATFKNIEKR